MSPGASATPRRIGRYELSARIASGGMASVYFARIVGAEGFSRVVAIKRMHPHMAEIPEFRAMFIDEARLAAQIHHPNVAAILDFVTDADELLLVMSYVHGASLAAISGLSGSDGLAEPLDPPVAVRIAVDALLGLHAAHTAKDGAGTPLGIVHRDVSPQNLLVSTEGVTIVLDFGVAKATERLNTSRQGELKGKVRYMAPEHILEGKVGPETDVYALSAVLWEILTGRRLFTGTNDAALVAQVLDGSVPSPETIVHRVPAALAAIVMRGLERDAAKRYPSGLAMAEALEGLALAASHRDVAAVVAERAHDIVAAREAALRNLHDGSADVPRAASVPDRTLTSPPLSPSPGEPQPPPASLVSASDETKRDAPAEAARARGRVLRGWVVPAFLGIGIASFAVTAIAMRVATVDDATLSPADDAHASLAASVEEPASASAPPVTTPSLATMPSATAPSVTAPVASSPPVNAARPARVRSPAPVDCARNPRVLGPDGVYHVRRECMGH